MACFFTMDSPQLPVSAMFTFEGIGIVLPLENKMKNPKGMGGWTGVLNTAMVFVACLYIGKVL